MYSEKWCLLAAPKRGKGRLAMTLYQLRVFEAVARRLNITQASLELHASQPAVSQQLKLLEEHYGASFFVRHNQGVKLTDKGEAFLNGLHPYCHDLKNSSADLKIMTLPGSLSVWPSAEAITFP